MPGQPRLAVFAKISCLLAVPTDRLLPDGARIVHTWFGIFFFNAPATTEIYTTEDTLSLHDALPISPTQRRSRRRSASAAHAASAATTKPRSEEHTSELQSPSVISYAVFCLKKK